MRAKFTVVLLLFVCLNVFGAQTTPVTVNQQESVSQLQAENEAMKKQLENLEKEVELYREDVRTKISEFEDEQSRWTAWMCLFITLLTAALGGALPLYINIRNDKQLKNSYENMLGGLKKQISSVETDAKSAKDALSEVTELKNDIEAIKKDIDKSKKNAERAAKRAMVSKLFAQAVSEKNLTKAIELYSKILEINPNIAEVYNNLGVLRKNMNDQAGALQDYNKAIELNPNDGDAYYNRGILREDMKDKAGALQDYDKAIELYPNHIRFYNNRGILKKEMKDYEGALQDFNKAIELDSNYAISYNNRADLYLLIKDLDNALKDANKSIELGGGFYSYVTRGEIFMAMNNYIDAINDFTQALSYNPNSIEAFEYRAKCYRKLAETEQDPAKKADLIAKAKADEKIVKSLKKKKKNPGKEKNDEGDGK